MRFFVRCLFPHFVGVAGVHDAKLGGAMEISQRLLARLAAHCRPVGSFAGSQHADWAYGGIVPEVFCIDN